MCQSKKITFIVSNMRAGGAQRVILNLAIAATKLDKYQVEVVLFQKEGMFLDELIKKGIKVINLNTKASLSVYKMYKYIKENKPDVMISTLIHINIAVGLAWLLAGGKHTGTKLFVREANVLVPRKAYFFDKVLLNLAKFIYGKCTGLIANSKDTLMSLRKVGINNSSSTIISNPVFFREDADKHYLKNKIKKSDSAIKVVAIGRLHEQKDFKTLLKAISIVLNTHDINLTILGKGQQESELKEYAKYLKIEEKVTFVEENKEPLSLISKHDIFVLSSIYEGFGNVLVEAMAVGCPVVSTKCAGGPVEILDNGNYGPLVDIQNPQQLSQAIIEVYTLPIDRQKLISRSMQYEVEYISKQYIDFFKL